MYSGYAGLLLLADARLPAGGHAHSGGLEPAAAAGAVTDVPELEGFLRGRLATTGLVTAALAAAACTAEAGEWARLDREADARTPSPAQRRASRAQGRSLLRAVRVPALDPLAELDEAGPHHPVVLGAAVAVAGGGPDEAATIAAYGAVTGPASAAVRLLGLDPLAVHRMLTSLAPQIDAVAVQAIDNPGAAASAPLLDLYAQQHLHADLRLFES